jgi:hypothetical protein
LGVGAGLFVGSGTAWAEPVSSATPGPSVNEPKPGGKAVRAIRSAIASTSSHGGSLRTTLGALTDNVGSRRSPSTARTTTALRPVVIGRVAKARLEVASLQTPQTLAERTIGAGSAAVVERRPAMPMAIIRDGIADAVVAALKRSSSPFDSPPAPLADSSIALAALGVSRRELSGAVPALRRSTTPALSTPIVAGGYEIAPSSVLNVGSFYGLIITPPALTGSVQGTQEFDVIDPNTHQPIGSFDAFVSTTNSLIIGGGISQQIYVTSVADGADPTATPPVGTVISKVTFGEAGRFGFLYSAMPSDPGTEISFKLLTPFGDVKIPMPYDATLVAGEVVRPMELNDEYYIAPAPGQELDVTSTSGVPPLFTDIQGEQVFAVYQRTDDGVDDNDAVIGTFKGYVTTTSDIMGTTTEAILVTEVLTGNVGTGPGDVPPAGSVYNVIYHFGIFYSSIPSDSGDVVTTEYRTIFGNFKLPFYEWSASSPLVYDSFEVPAAGYGLIPVTTLQPAGVNGLPPMEVQVQGYQQFNVVDSDGNVIGSVDGDVTYQWMPFGIYAEAILVTNVDGEGPPVGSQINFVNSPWKHWGAYYTAVPEGDDDVLAFTIVSPFGNIPIPVRYNAIKGFDDVTYYDPFV